MTGTRWTPFASAATGPRPLRALRGPSRAVWVRGVVALVLALLTLSADAAAQVQSAAPTGGETAQGIRPGDIVRLRVWREPDLSGEFAVDENATVVLPRVGRMDVASETAESLEQRLVEFYSEFLQHSSIDVTLLRRVQILGAVKNPGLYPVDPTMSVSDALALAGGITNQGNISRVELLRRGERMAFQVRESTRIGDSPIQSGDQLFVPERNWMSRNPGIIAAAITASVSLLLALVR